MFSTIGDIMMHVGDIMSTVGGGGVQYCGDIMSIVGVFSTMGDIMMRYHDACGHLKYSRNPYIRTKKLRTFEAEIFCYTPSKQELSPA